MIFMTLDQFQNCDIIDNQMSEKYISLDLFQSFTQKNITIPY